MVGGLGNDRFIVDYAGDKVYDAAGQGSDTAYTSVSSRAGRLAELLFHLPPIGGDRARGARDVLA